MKKLILNLAILTLPLFALPSTDLPTTVQVEMIGPGGELLKVYSIPSERDLAVDILFKPNIPMSLTNYTSWALEIEDVKAKLSTQIALDGEIPNLIHWDGVFDIHAKIKPGQSYTAKLLLVLSDNSILESDVIKFSTQSSSAYEKIHGEKNSILLYVIPKGGLHYTTVKTNTRRSRFIPNIYGDLSFVYNNIHTVGLSLEGTSNIISDYYSPDTSFMYSDLNIYYRYRLVGQPIRAPYESGIQILNRKNSKERLAMRKLSYGSRTTIEAGVKLYQTVFRGIGLAAETSNSLNPELAREFRGIMPTLFMDQALGSFRAQLGLGIGYSFLRASLITLTTEMSVTYNYFTHVAPGLILRYNITTGSTAADPGDGFGGRSHHIKNTFLMIGTVYYFKL